MTLVRRLARPLLAAQFIYGGVDQLRRPDTKAANAGPLVSSLAGTAIGPVSLPSDPAGLVRLNGGIMAGAGSLLALGRLPRLSALVLAASVIPTTLSGHAFWKEEDKEAKSRELGQVLKDVGLLGGLLITAVDTNGKPGLGWRAKRAGRDAQRAAKLAKADAKRTSGRLKREAELQVRRGRDAVGV